MNLTILLLELSGLVFLLSILIFYAGVKYSHYKLAGFNTSTPPSIILSLLVKKNNNKESFKIIDIRKKTDDQKIDNKSTNTNKEKFTSTVVKISITPRMTIYKTIDED